jgi:fumarate reductase subunit C
LGKKTSLRSCVVFLKHPQTLQNNFVSTPSPSLASQTFFEMMAMVMMLVLNTNNLKEKKHIDGNVDYLLQRT